MKNTTIKKETSSQQRTYSVLSIREMSKIALLVAMLAVSAYISIPIGPSPITFQTLIINITAILLVPSSSFTAMLIYMLIGLAGLPIFSGGAGGPAKLFGPTGGYILAFLIAVPVMSFTAKYFVRAFSRLIKNKTAAEITGTCANSILIGMTLIYFFGTVYMKFSLGTSWMQTLSLAVIPFIPLDIFKCIAASIIAVPVKRALAKAHIQ